MHFEHTKKNVFAQCRDTHFPSNELKCIVALKQTVESTNLRRKFDKLVWETACARKRKKSACSCDLSSLLLLSSGQSMNNARFALIILFNMQYFFCVCNRACENRMYRIESSATRKYTRFVQYTVAVNSKTTKKEQQFIWQCDTHGENRNGTIIVQSLCIIFLILAHSIVYCSNQNGKGIVSWNKGDWPGH